LPDQHLCQSDPFVRALKSHPNELTPKSWTSSPTKGVSSPGGAFVMKYQQPFTTVHEQIAIMRSRGLIINDEIFAKTHLIEICVF